MSKTSIINGLTKDDIVLLYKYMLVYENQIKKLKNNKGIDAQEKELKKITQSLIFKRCYQPELENNKLGNLRNEIYFTVQDNKTLSFLRHLRNSIGHCSIKKANKQYIFSDRNKRKKLTMLGNIDCSILESIIKLFV